MTDTKSWTAGQRATIDRQEIVTIERVTPAGRAIVKGRTFETNGRERKIGDTYRRSKLEPLTPEIQAEMDLVVRATQIRREASRLMKAIEKWLSGAFSIWGRSIPEAEDVARGEKLIAALRIVMEENNHATE